MFLPAEPPSPREICASGHSGNTGIHIFLAREKLSSLKFMLAAAAATTTGVQYIFSP